MGWDREVVIWVEVGWESIAGVGEYVGWLVGWVGGLIGLGYVVGQGETLVGWKPDMGCVMSQNVEVVAIGIDRLLMPQMSW